MQGECKRSNCRFRHLTPMQYDIEMSDYFQREYFQREQQQRMMYNGGGAPAADYPEYEYERRQQIRRVIGITFTYFVTGLLWSPYTLVGLT